LGGQQDQNGALVGFQPHILPFVLTHVRALVKRSVAGKAQAGD
jgi:hypothetical protein